MAKLETNIITPKRNSGKNADIIEDLEIMAQSIQEEFNRLNGGDYSALYDLISALQNDLLNYYRKSETYNKQEIDNKISTIPKFNIEVVDSLPISNINGYTVYLVRDKEDNNNMYTEYIYVNNKWEILGTQNIDFSDIYTKNEINTMIQTINNRMQQIETDLETLETVEIKEINEKLNELEEQIKNLNPEGYDEIIQRIEELEEQIKNLSFEGLDEINAKLADLEEQIKNLTPEGSADLNDRLTEVENQIGDITLILDILNGEVI